MQSRVYKTLKVSNYFITRQWQFSDANIRNLYKEMSQKDQQTFQINTKSILWEEYVENYCLGIRQHLLKQSPDSLSDCRGKMNR